MQSRICGKEDILEMTPTGFEPEFRKVHSKAMVSLTSFQVASAWNDVMRDDAHLSGLIIELMISRDRSRYYCHNRKTEGKSLARPKVEERHDDLLVHPAKLSTPPCMCTL